MGNLFSNTPVKSFLIERMITPDIHFGILTGGIQGLRWREGYYKLITCQEYNDKIIYQFDCQIFLEFSRGFNDEIQYTIQMEGEKQIGQIDGFVRNTYKNIGMDSDDLDKLVRLFKSI
jgi:hypothetical protein